MLEVEGLHAYYGRAHILADVALRVDKGEVVALLGRNGAGKSTTMKTVMGLVRAENGEVRFDGATISRLPSYRVSRLGLGYVPEDRRVFADLTVMENLEVGRQPPREGARRIVSDAWLASDIAGHGAMAITGPGVLGRESPTIRNAFSPA